MKITTAFLLAFSVSIAGISVAYGEDAAPATHHPYHHPHHRYHRLPAARDAARTPEPAPAAAAITPAPQAAPFGLAFPHIAPYPDGKGDEDGLSEDPNDCNKGCIDGNTPD
jgi:hypothetical protein